MQGTRLALDTVTLRLDYCNSVHAGLPTLTLVPLRVVTSKTIKREALYYLWLHFDHRRRYSVLKAATFHRLCYIDDRFHVT